MKVSELIEYLKTFDQDLPVWFTVAYDPERCYNELTKEWVTAGEVAHYHTLRDIDSTEPEGEIPALIIGACCIC
jgi:hypothetical protein